MRSRGNLYALAALKSQRGILAAEIVQLKRQLRHRKEMLIHVDATLRLLDPEIKVDSIRPKRAPKRIKLFRQGELGRLIIDAIRRSPDGVSAKEIVTALLKVGGHGESVRGTLSPRVRGNLAYLGSQGKVVKDGSGDTTVWRLPR
jgi:hypothetical protein